MVKNAGAAEMVVHRSGSLGLFSPVASSASISSCCSPVILMLGYFEWPCRGAGRRRSCACPLPGSRCTVPREGHVHPLRRRDLAIMSGRGRNRRTASNSTSRGFRDRRIPAPCRGGRSAALNMKLFRSQLRAGTAAAVSFLQRGIYFLICAYAHYKFVLPLSSCGYFPHRVMPRAPPRGLIAPGFVYCATICFQSPGGVSWRNVAADRPLKIARRWRRCLLGARFRRRQKIRRRHYGADRNGASGHGSTRRGRGWAAGH